MSPRRVYAAYAAARFIASPTHCSEMSSMGQLRSSAWNEARSARLSSRSAGTRASRPYRTCFRGPWPDSDHRRVLALAQVGAAQQEDLGHSETSP